MSEFFFHKVEMLEELTFNETRSIKREKQNENLFLINYELTLTLLMIKENIFQ